MSVVKTPTSWLPGTSTTSHLSLFHFTTTPANTVTAIELLANRLWYRTKAKINLLFGGGTQEASTTQPSKFPQELVELIISHLIHDKRTLLACSMTSYSWYIAAVPHLHHTLTTDNDPLSNGANGKYLWPRPLRKSYNLGLLPLVKRLRIRSGERPFNEFAPKKARLACPGLLFRTHEPPGTRNRLPPSIQLYAKHPTVFRASLANTSIPCPQRTRGLLPTDLVFHWTLPKPPRP
jgi:hypothetical protein